MGVGAEAGLTGWKEFWLALGSYGLVAVGAGILVGLLYLFFPSARGRWFPLQRLRWGRWAGGEVLLALLLLFLTPALITGLLKKSAFFLLIYAQEPSDLRMALWSGPLALPLTLALVFTTLNLVSQTYPADLGLSLVRWPRNVLLGYAGFILATPFILAILWLLLTQMARLSHPFMKLGEGDTTPVEWILVFFQATLLAPILEELLFRGLLQGWLRRATLGGQMIFLTMAWTLSILATLPNEPNQPLNLATVNVGRFIFTTILVLFYSGLLQYCKQKNLFQTEADFAVPEPAVRPLAEGEHPEDEDDVDAPLPDNEKSALREEAARRWRQQDLAQQKQKTLLSIVGSAQFFALIHPTWPDPIPLFVLGLILGWLAHRTQNLLPGMILHGLFNLVACLVLVLAG